MNTFGQRLLSARKMAGLSLQALADLMDTGISKQALNQYEKGMIKPLGSVVISISNALNIPVDYFYTESDFKLDNLEFRKKSKLSQKDIESVKYKTLDYLEKYLEIEELLNLKTDFTIPNLKVVVKTEDDIETAANNLRKFWNLGFDPIPCVLELLEEKGIKVFEIEAHDDFSGLSSNTTDGVAVVVVNKSESIGIVRKRFTAIHELAHLILKFPADMPEKIKEGFCYSFASAFLFPKENYLNGFGKKRSSILLEELVLLENYYGLSVQAIMKRANTLQLISDSKYRDFNIWLNKSNNKKKMLGDFQGNETPLRFKRLVLRALSENIISESKAAALLNVTLADIEKEFERVI